MWVRRCHPPAAGGPHHHPHTPYDGWVLGACAGLLMWLRVWQLQTAGQQLQTATLTVWWVCTRLCRFDMVVDRWQLQTARRAQHTGGELTDKLTDNSGVMFPPQAQPGACTRPPAQQLSTTPWYDQAQHPPTWQLNTKVTASPATRCITASGTVLGSLWWPQPCRSSSGGLPSCTWGGDEFGGVNDVRLCV